MSLEETATPVADKEGDGEEVEYAVSIDVDVDQAGGDDEDQLYDAPEPQDPNNKMTRAILHTGNTHAHFTDDFTLKIPSSTVRFRGSNVRVYEQRTSQILLEQQPTSSHAEDETEDHPKKSNEDGPEITVKEMRTISGFGLNFLRGTYTLVCLFFSCFLFIFCFQLLLFLFMDAVVEIGATSYQGRSIANFLGTLFAIPLFIYGLASAMTIAGCFIIDAWDGHTFLRKVGNWSIVFTEWASFIVFLAIPVMTWIVCLFANSPIWWQITALTWFCCVWAFYLFFAGSVIYYELNAAVMILQELDPTIRSWLGIARRAILVRQIYQFSGIMYFVRMVNQEQEDQLTRHERTSLYARMTLWSRCGCGRIYDKVDPPERLYSTDELLGIRNFVTSNSWSLDKLYCWNHRSQTIAVVRGPSAVHPNQMRSSLACSIIGSLMVLLLIVALCVWYDATVLAFVLTLLILVCICIPRARSTVIVYNMYRHVLSTQEESESMDNDDDEENDDDGIYQMSERFRVTRPRGCLCWSLFIIEIVILFIWPVVTLFVLRNYAIAALFVFIGIISAVRYYLNAAILAKELGSFEGIGQKGDTIDKSASYSNATWKAKSRLNTILRNVTRGQTRMMWMWIFAILVLIIIVFAIASLGTSVEESVSDVENVTLLEDFSYEPQPDLPYPSCRMRKGLEIPFSNSTALADYAFLAAVSYQNPLVVQSNLDTWFGKDFAKNELGVVAEFREQVIGGEAPVSYQFISFSERLLGVVVVRGSTTPWEWLTDAQLWLGAFLAGIIRQLLPIGDIWTPILDTLLKMNSFIQSESLSRVALYTQTTKFVKWLEASGNYTTIQIAGHSLGGGIAIITGAQTGVPAIAVSGPNAMMSRKTFDPPITEEALNTKVFNIVPAMDFVPRTDDIGDLYQNIQCRAPENHFEACHSIVRSLCEILYTCGSANRPVPCSCATQFGYPEATQNGNRTFTEVCGSERSNQ